MTAGLGVSGLGSRTPERNPRWAGRVAALRLVRGQAEDSGLQGELQGTVGAPKGGRAGGHGAELAAVSGLTRRPRGAQCTKPGVRGTDTAAGRPGADADPGDAQGDAGRRVRGALPAPLSLTSNISPMRTQSTRQKPMSAWLWMTNSWLKSG